MSQLLFPAELKRNSEPSVSKYTEEWEEIKGPLLEDLRTPEPLPATAAELPGPHPQDLFCNKVKGLPAEYS